MRHSYLFIIAIMLAVMTPRIAPAQSIAVKSNVLYDLTEHRRFPACRGDGFRRLLQGFRPW